MTSTPTRCVRPVRFRSALVLVAFCGGGCGRDPGGPGASPAALEIVYWMLASELEQPALLVSGIPEWLGYASSPLSVSLLHAATFVNAMQPGACGRLDFDTLTALPAQLAKPVDAAGEHDALHEAWARTLVPAAVT